MKMIVTKAGMKLVNANGFTKEAVKKFNVEIIPRYTSKNVIVIR